MSRIYKKTNFAGSDSLTGIAFGGGGGGGGGTRGRNGSPNVYSNNRSNATSTYGWRSDRSRLGSTSKSDKNENSVTSCLTEAAIVGAVTARVMKNPQAGKETAKISAIMCGVKEVI